MSFMIKGKGSKEEKNRYYVDYNLLSDGIHPGELLSRVYVKALQHEIETPKNRHQNKMTITIMTQGTYYS